MRLLPGLIRSYILPIILPIRMTMVKKSSWLSSLRAKLLLLTARLPLHPGTEISGALLVLLASIRSGFLREAALMQVRVVFGAVWCRMSIIQHHAGMDYRQRLRIHCISYPLNWADRVIKEKE